MANDPTEKRVAELDVEFKSMSKQLDSIATDLKQVLAITNQVGLLNERQQRHTNDLDRAFEDIKLSKVVSENATSEIKKEISEVAKDMDSLRTTSEAWINKGKGAWFVGSILWGFIQVVVLGTTGYIIRQYQELNIEVADVTYRVDTLVNRDKLEKGQK